LCRETRTLASVRYQTFQRVIVEKKQNESENDELMAKKRFSLPSKADHEEESHRWRALWLAEASFDCKLIEPKGRKVLVGRDFVARLQPVSART
jgi:hypothetical protein